jgi:catechol 2,3-dioxygenase-like lactoylglutathione lyase family enzyme
MIDHIGFPVSNYERSKAFYTLALAPLGYTLIMEVGPDQTEGGNAAAGFGAGGKPDFWSGSRDQSSAARCDRCQRPRRG